jgi:hypothetical protein
MDDFEDLIEVQGTPRIQRPLKDRLNPLHEFDDLEFYMRYRVNKTGFTEIFARVEPNLKDHGKKTNRPLTPVQQLSLALRYYATGDFQATAGDILGIHQSTVSKYMPELTNAIASLSTEVIRFPSSSVKTNSYFKDYCGISGISGVVDGTQIPIQSPGGQNAELFRCRKGFFSYNVQVVCDENLKIMDIVSGWPGSTHDSRIWNNSAICVEFEEGRIEGMLLGDSGYPLSPYLMIPYPYPPNSRQRGRFNRALCKARCTVERCIGVLKRRWPCLSRKLRCKYDRVPDIIVACAVLHNLCIEYNQPIEDDIDVAQETNADDAVRSISVNDEFVEYRPGSNFAFAGEEVRNMLSERFAV